MALMRRALVRARGGAEISFFVGPEVVVTFHPLLCFFPPFLFLFIFVCYNVFSFIC